MAGAVPACVLAVCSCRLLGEGVSVSCHRCESLSCCILLPFAFCGLKHLLGTEMFRIVLLLRGRLCYCELALCPGDRALHVFC